MLSAVTHTHTHAPPRLGTPHSIASLFGFAGLDFLPSIALECYVEDTFGSAFEMRLLVISILPVGHYL